jgi:hypothetical protein|tara:strand:- start:1769 stop:2062 length:294 start_codon:yes stop_codon:yes gene_type:complete
MSIETKVKQTRPDSDVDFFTPGDDIVTRLDELKTSGNIESYNLNELSENGLEKTMTFVFKDQATLSGFLDEDVSFTSRELRKSYCETNNIVIETQEG